MGFTADWEKPGGFVGKEALLSDKALGLKNLPKRLCQVRRHYHCAVGVAERKDPTANRVIVFNGIPPQTPKPLGPGEGSGSDAIPW